MPYPSTSSLLAIAQIAAVFYAYNSNYQTITHTTSALRIQKAAVAAHQTQQTRTVEGNPELAARLSLSADRPISISEGVVAYDSDSVSGFPVMESRELDDADDFGEIITREAEYKERVENFLSRGVVAVSIYSKVEQLIAEIFPSVLGNKKSVMSSHKNVVYFPDNLQNISSEMLRRKRICLKRSCKMSFRIP